MKFTFEPESRPLDGYTIKRAIHRGGFGEVYYAISDAGKEVALKLLQQNLEIELRGISQCLNLKHPNLVTIFDVKEDGDGDFWVVMEFVGGRNLSQEIHDHEKGMPMEEVRHWLAGVANGVKYLHDRGLVHRDLKPANIFSENGVVKVGDVGLSKFISSSRRSAHTQSVGTVYYMAPEVAKGRYGKEVDVYATGIMLFEMLTGRVPFDGESAGEILMKHLSEQPDLSVLPERIRPVLKRALEKDPEQRTGTMLGLLEQFNAAVIGAPLPDHGATPSGSPSTSPIENTTTQTFGAAAAKPKQTYRRAEPHRPKHRAHGSPRHREHRVEPSGFWGPIHLWMQKWGWIVVIAILLIGPGTAGGIVRLSLVAVMLFGVIYAIIRAFEYLQNTAASHWGESSGPPAQNVTHRQHPAHQYRPPARHNVALDPETIRRVPLFTRISDTTSAFSFAIFNSVVIAAGLLAVSPGMFGYKQGMPMSSVLPELVYFAGIAAIASCGILLLCKMLEGRMIDVYTRRILQLGVGLLVGLAAWWLADFLFIDFSGRGDTDAIFNYFGSHQLADRNQPTLAGFMVFFGALFMVRRWRWQADSFRPNRFQVRSVLGTLLIAFVILTVFSFQPLWGMIWAATISSAVQLSAVWIPENRRRRLAQGGPNA